MRRLVLRSALGILATLSACKSSDPCAGYDGSCLAVEVRAATAQSAKMLSTRITLGSATPVERTTTPKEGESTSFPFVFPVQLGSYAGPVDIAVQTQLEGGLPWRGATATTVAQGEHASTFVELRPEGAGGSDLSMQPDGGGSDMPPPTPAPSARMGAGMAYFTARGSMILFGGFESANSMLADTWEWVDGKWAPLKGGGTGPRARSTNLAFDAGRQSVVLFGGYLGRGVGDDETWALSRAGAWTRVVAPGPRTRAEPALVYDGARQRLLLYGGIVVETGQILTDLWELRTTDTAWRLILSTGPKVRTPTMLTLGSAVYLVGSDDATSVRLWTVDNVAINPTNAGGNLPSGRVAAAVGLDPALRSIYVMGGLAADTQKNLDDIHALNLATGQWNAIATLTKPDPRFGASFDYHVPSKAFLFFGGATGTLNSFRPFKDSWLISDRSVKRLD